MDNGLPGAGDPSLGYSKYYTSIIRIWTIWKVLKFSIMILISYNSIEIVVRAYHQDLNLVLLEDLILELDYQVSAHSNFIYILYFLALRLLLIQYSLISASPAEGNVYEA